MGEDRKKQYREDVQKSFTHTNPLPTTKPPQPRVKEELNMKKAHPEMKDAGFYNIGDGEAWIWLTPGWSAQIHLVRHDMPENEFRELVKKIASQKRKDT
jgi:hypothetical protein